MIEMRQAELRDRIDELEAALEKVADELGSLRDDVEEVLGIENEEEVPEKES